MRTAVEIRALVARENHALLSTIHAGLDGWPFGSVAPYALTPEGDPVLLLSTIAEHTKNLIVDPRASLLVLDAEAREDPLAGARATLLGRAVPADGAASVVARTAYEARFPDAGERLVAHDFVLHVLRVERVRWIAGFGRMGWLERHAWSSPPVPGG